MNAADSSKRGDEIINRLAVPIWDRFNLFLYWYIC